MASFLPRLIGEDIELSSSGQNLGTIRADASQMEQVIMNLAGQFRDGMPTGGKLLIGHAQCDLDQSYSRQPSLMKPLLRTA